MKFEVETNGSRLPAGGRLVIAGGIVALIVLALASCQAVFTFSPLSFLQRAPSTLTVDQKVSYAEEALASGDREALTAVYDDLAAAASADDADPEVQYVAAQVALELSGVSGVLDSALEALAGGGGSQEELLSGAADALQNIDTDMLEAAAGFLTDVDSAASGPDLTATDYFVGGVGLILAGTPEGADPIASAGENPNLDAAEQFLTKGAEELPDGDPARQLIDSYLTALQGAR